MLRTSPSVVTSYTRTFALTVASLHDTHLHVFLSSFVCRLPLFLSLSLSFLSPSLPLCLFSLTHSLSFSLSLSLSLPLFLSHSLPLSFSLSPSLSLSLSLPLSLFIGHATSKCLKRGKPRRSAFPDVLSPCPSPVPPLQAVPLPDMLLQPGGHEPAVEPSGLREGAVGDANTPQELLCQGTVKPACNGRSPQGQYTGYCEQVGWFNPLPTIRNS